MRLLTYETNGSTALGIEINGRVANLAKAAEAAGQRGIPGDMRSFLDAGDTAMQSARAAHEYLTGGKSGDNIYPAKDSIKITAPILDPRKIICIGLNYMDHVLEQKIKPPEKPIIFAKYATSIIGPGDTIIRPRLTEQLDYEVELAVIIGKKARHVSEADAFEYVAGYTIVHDVSARDIQFGDGQWVRAKTFDTFCPMGPYLVTKDEVKDPHNLGIRAIINGQALQDSNTKNLIFKVPHLIAFISAAFTLEPGDVISTGTPDGVGVFRNPKVFLKEGDVCRLEIDGLGTLENPVEDEQR